MKKMRSLILSCCLLFSSHQQAQANCADASFVAGIAVFTITAIPALLYGIIALPISQSDMAMEPRCGDKDSYSFCCGFKVNSSDVVRTNCVPQLGNHPQCEVERTPFCAADGNFSDLSPALSQGKSWKGPLTISSSVCLGYGVVWLVLAGVAGVVVAFN